MSNPKISILSKNDRLAVVLFPLMLPICLSCQNPMIRRGGDISLNVNDERMMKDAGIQHYGTELDGRYYCRACLEAGKGVFDCAMCQQERPISQLFDGQGYEYDRLCTVCFETEPAAKWAAFIDKLKDSHQWDYS
jgi:hypothetical protein